MSNKLTGRVLGYIAPTIIIGLCVIIYYFYKHATIKIDYWKYALPIVLPYIPHLLSMCLLNNMDRVMIRNICGVESVALYSLAYTCGMIITMLVSSVNSAYAPWLAEKLNVGEYDVIRKYTIPYICFFSFSR